MEEISRDLLLKKLQHWIGTNIYVHIEVNPGGYFRNGKASLHQVHVKGEQSIRVFLELDEQASIIHVDHLTHMRLADDLVIVTAYDEHGRLARTLEVSSRPFPI
ncbi:DUF1806 family protein [Halalkalibacter urbisdiaboli]|uniref:DUF1806 family protein n=1 Tax=Halalkalibacter urbisdiaboli TaxID=1960589 RepID=UPI000B43F048|nr:DUF1806 family protein [Halalkalibacter urbisdiaboli]